MELFEEHCYKNYLKKNRKVESLILEYLKKELPWIDTEKRGEKDG
jgi:hypothetical protein